MTDNQQCLVDLSKQALFCMALCVGLILIGLIT